MPAKLMTAAGGGITLDAASTATDKTITVPADNGTLVYANSSGNVGIGTSSPSARLQVNSAYSTDTTPQATILESGGGIGTAMFFGLKSDGTRWIMSKDGSASTAYPMAFYTGTSERMRIDSSGNLLVGTTSATGTFTLVGNQYNVSTFRVAANGNVGISWRNASNTEVGYVQVNASTTTYATSSDYRLKENIAPMTGALSTVSQLKPCTYTWKLTGESTQGFIAHELQEVVPECVVGEKDAVDEEGNPKYQGIDTSFLVATLTAAIQELKAVVDAQAARIEALENK